MLNKNKYFLATTSLEEYWNTSDSLLYLGEWCLRYDRRSYWEGLDGTLMDSPFDDVQEVYAAYNQVGDIYERVLPVLASAMNSMHGKNYSLRYWRILLGPWLYSYLSVMYDRYTHISSALEQFPNLTTIVLSERSFIVPSDTLEFYCRLSDDSFNLQIFSNILGSLGRNFPSRELQFEPSSLYNRVTGGSWKHRLLNRVTTLYGRIAFGLFSASVVFKDSYFPRKQEFQMFMRLWGRALPVRGVEDNYVQYQLNVGMREELKNVSFGGDSFSRCLSDVLFSDIPKCFVEGYQETCDTGKGKYPASTRSIFSANGWYYDEVFKYWAAANAEKGTLLLGTPHGGSYGSRLYAFTINHETAITDYYYSWGWDKKDCSAKVVQMPAPKLMGVKEIPASNAKKGILWATTASPRYLLQYPHAPTLFRDYLQWNRRFALALSDDLLSEVRLRAHYQDYGWDLVSRLKESVPSIKLDTWDVPFQESMSDCRLYVCDHLSTTFTEALAANKPTILFWDPSANILRPEAIPYFDLLRSNGILFDSPERAAEAIANIYNDVESWWNTTARKEAVREFCMQHARRSSDALNLWVDELNRVVVDKK
jgi:putative transferase (TIGR04331 family)